MFLQPLGSFLPKTALTNEDFLDLPRLFSFGEIRPGLAEGTEELAPDDPVDEKKQDPTHDRA